MQRRRALIFVAAAAVLLFAVGGWLWVRARHSIEATDTAVLDLRERSVTRGQNASESAPLQISRTTKHLVLDLPIGSKEGPYDVGLLTENGNQIVSASGTAQLSNHVTALRVDLDVSGVRPGAYSLGVREGGLEWTRYPIHVF
jgi:hypothetical protein